MSHNANLTDRVWRRALFMAALGAGLALSAPVLADVPPATGALGSPQQTSNKLLADARKAIRDGNGRLALINLRNAVTADPHNTDARVLLGFVLVQAGDRGAAEQELRLARKDGAPPSQVLPPLFDVMLARGEDQVLLTQFPDPGPNPSLPEASAILMARAVALQDLNRPTEAVDAIDRSLALRRDARGLIIRARIAVRQGQMADARKFVDEAISKATTAEPLLFKAGLLLTAGENQAALDLCNQLLEKYPGNLEGRFARIEAYIALNQDDKAKPEVDSILAKNPGLGLGVYYRALLLGRSGDAKAAWSVAQNLPADFRDAQPRIALMVAEMANNSGNGDTAASILGRLLLKDPSSALARLRLASIRLKQNNPAEALKVLDPIKDSADIRVQETLSNAYVALNRRPEALSAMRKVDANGKAPAEIKRIIAVLELQTGQTEQGIRDLTQLNAHDPTNLTIATPLIEALMQVKRYPEALAAANKLGADPKQSSRALIFRGAILLAQKDNAGAQAAFDKAVAAEPNNVAALYARAEFLAVTQKFAESGRDLQAILAMDPKNLGALLKLAEIGAQQGRDQDVRNYLGRAIAAAPQSPGPRMTLVRYLIGRKDFKSALPAAADFAQRQPANTDAVTLLGYVQFALGQKNEAVATYRRLVALSPAAAAPEVLLGNALAAAGDRAGAASAMEAAVKRGPASLEVRSAQVSLLLGQGSNDAALASARAFQASSPGTGSDVLLSDVLARTKQQDQAVAVLTKSFADRPNNLVLTKLVTYAIQAKDTNRAADLMSKWLAGHPDDMVVRLEYANLFMQQEDSVHAIPQYEILLKQSPDNPLALNNLGWLIQASNPQRALALLSRAATLVPNSPDVADTLGWFKVQQKDAAAGLALLDKAHGLKPKDGEITYHLVLAMDANAKHDAARGLLKALLASGVPFKDRAAAVQLSTGWH